MTVCFQVPKLGYRLTIRTTAAFTVCPHSVETMLFKRRNTHMRVAYVHIARASIHALNFGLCGQCAHDKNVSMQTR
jgi:hypothetical protein